MEKPHETPHGLPHGCAEKGGSDLSDIRLMFILKYGHLPNGELYFLLKNDRNFREMYRFCDERLTKWHKRDSVRFN